MWSHRRWYSHWVLVLLWSDISLLCPNSSLLNCNFYSVPYFLGLKYVTCFFILQSLKVKESLRRDSQLTLLNSSGTVKDNKMRTFEVGPNAFCMRWPGTYSERVDLLWCDGANLSGSRITEGTTLWAPLWVRFKLGWETPGHHDLQAPSLCFWLRMQCGQLLKLLPPGSVMMGPGSPEKLSFLKLHLSGILLQWKVTNTQMFLACFYTDILIIIS